MHLRHQEAVQQRVEGPHPDDLASSKLKREGLSAVAAAVKLHRGHLSQRTVEVSHRGWSTRELYSSSNLFTVLTFPVSGRTCTFLPFVRVPV